MLVAKEDGAGLGAGGHRLRGIRRVRRTATSLRCDRTRNYTALLADTKRFRPAPLAQQNTADHLNPKLWGQAAAGGDTAAMQGPALLSWSPCGAALALAAGGRLYLHRPPPQQASALGVTGSAAENLAEVSDDDSTRWAEQRLGSAEGSSEDQKGPGCEDGGHGHVKGLATAGGCLVVMARIRDTAKSTLDGGSGIGVAGEPEGGGRLAAVEEHSRSAPTAARGSGSGGSGVGCCEVLCVEWSALCPAQPGSADALAADCVVTCEAGSVSAGAGEAEHSGVAVRWADSDTATTVPAHHLRSCAPKLLSDSNRRHRLVRWHCLGRRRRWSFAATQNAPRKPQGRATPGAWCCCCSGAGGWLRSTTARCTSGSGAEMLRAREAGSCCC